AATLYFQAQRLRMELGTPIFLSEQAQYDTLEQNLVAELSVESIAAAKHTSYSNQALFDLAHTILR
ncbi:MAG: hypothetical protein AAGM67_21980, partial [Bacteroidota bacterium]